MRRSFLILAGAALLWIAGTAPLAAPAATGEDPDGFVRVRVSTNQTMRDLLRGHFAERVYCQEDCTVQTRLVLPSAQARELGFPGVRTGYYVEVGRVDHVEVEGGRWTRVEIPLTRSAKRRIRKAEDGVKLHGQLLADSTESGRYGDASWVRSCKWPKG